MRASLRKRTAVVERRRVAERMGEKLKQKREIEREGGRKVGYIYGGVGGSGIMCVCGGEGGVDSSYSFLFVFVVRVGVGLSVLLPRFFFLFS